MTRKTAWKGAVFSLVCFLLAVCCIVPSVRGILTSIAQQIVGQDVRYFNNELQNDGIDTNNYNFGYDRKAVADADVKAGSKKYEIEGYTMPWLNKGEEVKIQITGKQKILGNKRLDRKGKVELAFGFILLMYPVAMYLSYIFR